LDLDALDDADLARGLRAGVERFLVAEGHGFAVSIAYEAVWRAGSHDAEQLQRAGALFLVAVGRPDFEFGAAHARIVGHAMRAEASGLWGAVARAMP
jgi:hypothetical protein